MIEPDRPRLGVTRQCRLLSLPRSTFYYQATGETPANLSLMKRIDEIFMDSPFFGTRQMVRALRREGQKVNRKRISRLMLKMGLEAIYRKPNTSRPHPEHRIYPYLLRDVDITAPNQVWCADITYIPMRKGFLYLVAVMDWHSRKVLSWRLSNSMEASFCVEALSEALARYGSPEIFNTDQGSQFTDTDFVQVLKNAGVKISMDGRGRCMDNVMVERLWRSLKYENVYLHAYETGSEARAGIENWIRFYNERHPHSSLDGGTPNEAYCPKPGAATPTPTATRAAA